MIRGCNVADDSKIIAVVVTYFPELDVLDKVITAIAAQVPAVIVVDNGNQPEIGDLCPRRKAEYCPMPENLGLAAAQNHGIALALQMGASHVLLMDQDSLPAPDMVVEQRRIERALRDEGVSRIGAIGARYTGRHATNESFFVRFGWLKFRRVFCSETRRRHVRSDFLISSGALFTRDALHEVGLMDEGLFIDHIDTDWFLRANHYGYFSYGACDAAMEHSLGEHTVRVWLGRWRYLPLHKPFRYYYMFRNSLLIYRKDYAPAKWLINDFVRLWFILVFYTLFAAPRLERLGLIFKGVVDGVFGRRGPGVAVQAST